MKPLQVTIYFHISFKHLIACNRRCIKDLHEWKESIKPFQKIKTFVFSFCQMKIIFGFKDRQIKEFAFTLFLQ